MNIKYNSKENILSIFEKFKKYYGVAQTPLHFKTTEQLAIAVVLSAQTTDNQVNKVTPHLFKIFPDMASLAKGDLNQIEKIVYSTGFYKNKAKNIRNLAVEVTEKYNGFIPGDFQQLLKLPGIGRKTANVIMDCAFHQSVGIVVDTHVKRLSFRLGWTREKSPAKIEKDLMNVVPKECWHDISLYMIFHGRRFCMARKPDCTGCFLNSQCPASEI
ncbi:MAG: endonuclease III [Spirochaetia bacterium]|nr:endonuclease III [Spirochaetia bacterium]